MRETGDTMWSRHAADELVSLLRPDQLTLVCGPRKGAEDVLYAIGQILAISPASVSVSALSQPATTSPEELERRLDGRRLLFDLEALCWSPWLGLAPVRFLRSRTRRHGVIAVWPGRVEKHFATFSTPGRRDFVRESASGITLITPQLTSFPDQVPFTIERL